MKLPNRYILRHGYRRHGNIWNFTEYIWDCDLLMFVKFDGTKLQKCFLNRPSYVTNFLQVSIDGLQEACEELNTHHNFYEKELLQFIDNIV